MAIKRFKRKLGFLVKKYLLDQHKEKITHVEIKQLKKILFIRYDGKFGDCVVSSFVYRELKKNNPNLQIDVIAAENVQPFLKKNQHIDHIYLVKARKLSAFIKLGNRLTKNHYDVVVDITERLRNRDVILLTRINAKINVGYDKTALKLFNINIPKNEWHMSVMYKTVLEKLGCTDIDTQYDIPYDAATAKEIAHFLQTEVKDKYITVNFFGASRKRIFTPENMRKILHSLQRDYATNPGKIVLLTYPAVTPLLKKVLADITLTKDKFYLYEKTKTLFDTIELIRGCELLISVDTSVVHVAAGLNKKIIIFINQDNIKKWYPNSSQACKVVPFDKNVNDASILLKKDFSLLNAQNIK